MKNWLAKVGSIARKINSIGLNLYTRESYSQEGEDLILLRVFEHVEHGFYVDVGALHPQRFSNTYLFYLRGWSGINIDATPGSMRPFKRVRPRDINLEAAIASVQSKMTFFVFNEPALNSFDHELSSSRNKGDYRIEKEIEITTTTLRNVLMQYLPTDQKINFLSVDVEGFDLEVIQSNDWKKFRPEYVLVECLDLRLEEISNNKVYQFLTEQGYTFFAKTVCTVIFQDSTHVA